MAKLASACPWRTRHLSSWYDTSNCQCSWFSIPPHRLAKFLRNHLPAQDVITNLTRLLTIPFRLIDHHTDCLQYRLPPIQATWISRQIASGLPWPSPQDLASFRTPFPFPFSCLPVFLLLTLLSTNRWSQSMLTQGATPSRRGRSPFDMGTPARCTCGGRDDRSPPSPLFHAPDGSILANPDRKPCQSFNKKGGLHGSLYFSKNWSQRS